jgi:hypothetical protein
MMQGHGVLTRGFCRKLPHLTTGIAAAIALIAMAVPAVAQRPEAQQRPNILALLAAFARPAFAQDTPANNLEIVHEKLKADKKLIVAKYMELTESEAKKFWPVYEEYQKDLQQIDQRLLGLLQSYAVDYRNKSLTDEKAKTLLDEWIVIENDDAKRRGSYAAKVLQVLPAKKVARYLQIENKIRAVIKYDLAQGVPLVR